MSRHNFLRLCARSHLPLAVLAILSASPAHAFMLNQYLPENMPGFATSPPVSILNRSQPLYQPLNIHLGAITLNPSFSATALYNSAPNNGPPAAGFTLSPSLQWRSPVLGFGAYAALQSTRYPGELTQNISGTTIALGEILPTPQNRFILGFVHLRTQSSGFALLPLNLSKPVTITSTQLRLQDDISSGQFLLTPQFSFSSTRFSSTPATQSVQTGGGLTLAFLPDGISQLSLHLQAFSVRNQPGSQTAMNYSALAGIANRRLGLWNLRLLAGISARQPAHAGKSTIIPAFEASFSWMPDLLTSLSLTAAHETENPNRLDPSSTTFTQAEASIAHEYLRNLILTANITATRAAFSGTSLTESIITSQCAATWKLNRQLALSFAYGYNNRQSNFLRAAQQHLVSLTLRWQP